MAVALLGLTVAVPQDASLGLDTSLESLVQPWRGGENVAGLDQVDLDDEDLGDLLDRLDGAGLDRDLARNLDAAALAALLDGLSPQELAALGLSAKAAADLVARLRDPDLTPQELEAIADDLADRGLAFSNRDADGRFDAGEIAYADVDGDGRVSEGDLRLGALALLLGLDAALDREARDALEAYEDAGAIGLDRPASAATRDAATAATAPLSVDGYPTDRAIGPLGVVCAPLYSPSLTCHTRTFVHGAVTRSGGDYWFPLDATRVPLELAPFAPGHRASGAISLVLHPQEWTPVPTLTPGDALTFSNADAASIELARDDAGMVWARGPAGPVTLNLGWAVDLAYYDLPVAADVTPADVPEDLRPSLDATTRSVGLRVADLAGARDRAYGDTVRALAAFLRDFQVGPLPDRDAQPDDVLAYAEARIGCARHRAETFVVAAQSVGIPARLVLNEAHAFAEAYVPASGWHLVDVGACARHEVRPLAELEEIRAQQDLLYANGDAPSSQADRDLAPVATRIDITSWPASLRPNQDFTIGGVVATDAAKVPQGIPITFTYNRTKEDPGTPFCSTRSEADQTFTATCRLPSGMPPAPPTGWQLVARLAPSALAGAPSREAYSDPPFAVQKATTLQLVGPAKTASQGPVAYVALLRDEDGAGVAGRPVALRVDAGANQTRFTDGSGRAHFTFTLDAGRHQLAAAWAGDDFYDPAQGTLGIEAAAVQLTLTAQPTALEAGRLTVEGRLATAAGPQANRNLSAAWANDPDGSQQVRAATTDKDGRFSLTFSGDPRPGPGLVAVLDPVSGVAVQAVFVRTLDATAHLDVPERWAAGSPVPVTVAVAGPTGPIPLVLHVDGLAVADLAAGGDLTGKARLTIPAGTHTITVHAGDGVRLQADPAEVHVAAVAATLPSLPPMAPGSMLTLTGTLRSDGEPLATALTLRGPGVNATGASAADGTFRLPFRLPADAPAGNTTFLLEAPAVGLQQEVTLLLQRPANLDLDVPAFSLQAFGSTDIVVRGEGTVRVRADGAFVGEGGRLQVPTATWFLRRVEVAATVTPTTDGLAAASATQTMTVVNPVSLLSLPVFVLAASLGTTRGVQALRHRHAHRNRLLPKRPRSPIRLLQPDLPARVPAAFDPAVDGTLVLRLPRSRRPWVASEHGQRLPSRLEGRRIHIALAQLAPGPHTFEFHDGRRTLLWSCLVTDLRGALDQATLDILARIGRAEPWPAPLLQWELGLRAVGTHPEDARRLRAEAERTLYAGEALTRDRLHAFFLAVDQAQARRPT